MKTKTEIIKGVRELFPEAQFCVDVDGNLTMSLEGVFVDHEWKNGTYINE